VSGRVSERARDLCLQVCTSVFRMIHCLHLGRLLVAKPKVSFLIQAEAALDLNICSKANKRTRWY